MKQDLVLSNLHLRDLNPRICGREVCAPGHTFGPAVREYHLLHYVVRGTGVFRRAQAVYTLRAGDIFVIRPGESTVYAADIDWENYNYIRGRLLGIVEGEPFLLCCNFSDIVTNSLIVLSTANGEVFEFSPSISLKDGTLTVPESGVYDFTRY